MTKTGRSEGAAMRSHNQIAAIMMCTDRYSFRSTRRRDADTGISKSISHLVRSKSGPLSIALERVVKVLADQLGWLLDKQEVVSATGSYPASSDCAPRAGRGCLPDHCPEEQIKEQLCRPPLLPSRRPASSLIASIEKDFNAPAYAEVE
jgi:hypothetical protein